MTGEMKRRDMLSTGVIATVLSTLPRPGQPAGEAIAAEAPDPTGGDTAWRVSNPSDTVVGYAVAESILPGDTLFLRLRFKSDSGAGNCNISIYRAGYDPSGREDAQTTFPHTVASSLALDEQDERAAELGLNEATGWDTVSIQTDDAWAPGFYVAKLVSAAPNEYGTFDASQIFFVVRTPADTAADILALVPFNTAHAYTPFGGASLYGFNSDRNTGTTGKAAYGVSYNRPIADGYQDWNGFWQLLSGYPTWYWLEKNGYDVAYVSDTDFEPADSGAGTGGAIARLADPNTRPKILLVAGHSEYWSDAMFNAFLTAREGDPANGLPAVHLLFLCGNSVYWRVRFEGRRMICYKNDWIKDTVIDPATGLPYATNLFRSRENGMPENGLLGVMSVADDDRPPGAPFLVAQGPGVVGWEWDTIVNNGAGPADCQIIRTWVTDRSVGQGDYRAYNLYPAVGSQPPFSDVRLPTDTAPGGTERIAEDDPIEIALEFTVLTDGYVTNARYFLGPDEPEGPYERFARLWRGTEVIGFTSFKDFAQSRGGWCELSLNATSGTDLIAVLAGEVYRLSVTFNKQYGISTAAFANGPRATPEISVAANSSFYTRNIGELPDTASPDGFYCYIDLQFLPKGVLDGDNFNKSTAILWRHGDALIFAAGCIYWGAGLAQPPAGAATLRISNASVGSVKEITKFVLSQMLIKANPAPPGACQ